MLANACTNAEISICLGAVIHKNSNQRKFHLNTKRCQFMMKESDLKALPNCHSVNYRDITINSVQLVAKTLIHRRKRSMHGD